MLLKRRLPRIACWPVAVAFRLKVRLNVKKPRVVGQDRPVAIAVQVGVAAVCHIQDYEQDIIKKHEKTRRDKEDDRTKLIGTISADISRGKPGDIQLPLGFLIADSPSPTSTTWSARAATAW